MNTWFEDFVDEDTGEVVSIERNEIVLDRDTILEKHNIKLSKQCKNSSSSQRRFSTVDYAIIHNTLQKDP